MLRKHPLDTLCVKQLKLAHDLEMFQKEGETDEQRCTAIQTRIGVLSVSGFSLEQLNEELASAKKTADYFLCATLQAEIKSRRTRPDRRRLMDRLLQYENHYSSDVEGHPPKDSCSA